MTMNVVRDGKAQRAPMSDEAYEAMRLCSGQYYATRSFETSHETEMKAQGRSETSCRKSQQDIRNEVSGLIGTKLT